LDTCLSLSTLRSFLSLSLDELCIRFFIFFPTEIYPSSPTGDRSCSTASITESLAPPCSSLSFNSASASKSNSFDSD
ncbi:unnamed protein product, partial [Brassica rapa subsp. narinosa]